MDNYVSQFHPHLHWSAPKSVRQKTGSYLVLHGRKRNPVWYCKAVNKIIAFKAIEINQIPDHTDKNNPKEDGNKGIFFISGFALFSNLFLPLPQQLSVSLSLLPLVDVSQFLRPRPLYKYTSPG